MQTAKLLFFQRVIMETFHQTFFPRALVDKLFGQQAFVRTGFFGAQSIIRGFL